MNQFTVPQFIDVEDKIFGPITPRQFIILLCTGLLCFIFFRLADTTLFIVLTLVFGGFALMLAFAKINGQSFHFFLLNIVENLLRPSLRIWNKLYTKAELMDLITQPAAQAVVSEPVKKASSRAHIRDLSLMVNTGGYYKPE